MNDIRNITKAYCARATEEDKEEAKKFFRSLDADCDGRVSLAEYKSRVRRPFTHETLFKCLDKNGDGSLDYEEVLTLHYMQKWGMRACAGSCRAWLLGPYFSCTLCEKNHPKSFDLCCSCYGGGKYEHHHSPASLLDSHSMRRLLITKLINTAQLSLHDDEVEFHNAKNGWDDDQ